MGMPWLRHFPLFNSTFKEFDSQVSFTYSFFEENIYERIEQRFNRVNKEIIENKDDEEFERSKDMLDYFLDQMEEAKRGGDDLGEFKWVKKIIFLICYKK